MRDSSILPRLTGRTLCDAKCGEVQIRPWPRLEFFLAILAEFGRGLAAARRYESLRYGRGRQAGIGPADIPRQIFAEFYATRRESDDARPRRGAQYTSWPPFTGISAPVT